MKSRSGDVALFAGPPAGVLGRLTSTDPFQQLQSALDLLDEQFSSPEPFTLRGCTQCYGDKDFEDLSGPVHLVPDDLVVAAVLEVPGHWSDFPGLFRRMAPRILRAAVMGELHVFPDVLATRLLEADWQQWPAPQRDAVTGLWHAWLRATLHRFPSTVPVGDALRVIGPRSGPLVWSRFFPDHTSTTKNSYRALARWLPHVPLNTRTGTSEADPSVLDAIGHGMDMGDCGGPSIFICPACPGMPYAHRYDC